MFSLELRLSTFRISALKKSLADLLPCIKSSHRVEALARGLGFRTYAAFLVAMKQKPMTVLRADGPSFVEYLRNHGFETSALAFYRAVTKEIIFEVLERHPKLSMNGFGYGQPKRLGTRLETAYEHHARFLRDRQQFSDYDSVDQFLRALVFLNQVPATKTVRPDTNSYRVKHIAEKFPCKWPTGEELGPGYVSNGALIAAAIYKGFRFRTYKDYLGWDVLTVDFNMLRAVLDELHCRFLPDSSRAKTNTKAAA